jgi:hypothetical protein
LFGAPWHEEGCYAMPEGTSTAPCLSTNPRRTHQPADQRLRLAHP